MIIMNLKSDKSVDYNSKFTQAERVKDKYQS